MAYSLEEFEQPAEITPEGVLAKNLKVYGKGRAGAADLHTKEGRPSITELYERVNKSLSTPVDYSKLSGINKAAEEQSMNNFLGGLAMQTLGGKRIAPSGAKLVDEAASEKPLRPNAADIGWTNPQTGEFVENPRMVRDREDKISMNRIDALVKEQEREAAIALSQDRREDAATAKANAEQLKQMMVALASGNQQIAAALASARIAELGNRHQGGGKPLNRAEGQDLTTMSSDYTSLGKASSEFKDEYSKGIGGRPQVAGGNWITNNFPEARDVFTGKKSQKAMDERAAWWKQQEYYNTMPERHKMFGSAFTPGEKAAWDAAAITEGMKPDAIRANLLARQQVLEQRARRLHDMQIANGKNPTAVRAGLGAFHGKHLGVDEDDETPSPAPRPRNYPKAPAGAVKEIP